MRLLPVILIVVLAIYCWIEIAQSDRTQVRLAPRWLWALVVLIPLAGATAWLTMGRPNGTSPEPRPPRSRPRPIAPDDDPDFLRSLDDDKRHKHDD